MMPPKLKFTTDEDQTIKELFNRTKMKNDQIVTEFTERHRKIAFKSLKARYEGSYYFVQFNVV